MGRPKGSKEKFDQSSISKRIHKLRKLLKTKDDIKFLNDVRDGKYANCSMSLRMKAAQIMLDKAIPESREVVGANGGPMELVIKNMISGPAREK